jgi:hypothetical protein
MIHFVSIEVEINMPNKKAILIRVPTDVKTWLEQNALANSRSTSGELVHMLKELFEAGQERLTRGAGGQHDADIRP